MIVTIVDVIGITVFKAQQFCRHDSSFSPLKLLSGGRTIAIALLPIYFVIIITIIITTMKITIMILSALQST